jgi:hypothetical protein
VSRAGALASQRPAALRRWLDRSRTAAVVLDGPAAGGADAQAFARIGNGPRSFTPVPVVASERVLSERLVQASGVLGRLGVLQGVSEVSPATRDALGYGEAVQTLYQGDRPSLDGLRGYVTGLAFADAVRHGLSTGAIEGRLERPGVFTNALLAPWDPRLPGAGSPALLAFVPQFQAATLIPPSQGGEPYSGTYFPDGSWVNASATPLGRKPGSAPPAL